MTVEEVYTNTFDARLLAWTEVGVTPYLQNTDADSINTNTDLREEGDWTFPVSAGSGTINSIKLRLENRLTVLDCGSADVYVWDGTSWVYVGVIGAWNTFGTFNWEEIDVSAILNTWAKINACEVYFHYNKFLTGIIHVRRLTRKVDYTVAAAGVASKRLLVGVGL